MTPTRRLDDDRGSASVLVLVVIAVTVAVLVAGLTSAGARVARVRAEGAADSAALVAAAAAIGLVPGEPCTRAEQAAHDLGAVLLDCRTAGARARVVVRSGPATLGVRAVAVAGPPGGASI